MAEHESSPGILSAPLHWRVRVCRWLLRALLFVWGTLVVNIFTGTIANLNTTTSDTPLAKLYIIHLAQTYPLPVWSSLGFLAALTLLSGLGSRERQVIPALPLSEQDRIHMLRRLRARYEQVLAQSLQGAVQLELGLAERPAAVQNAISLSLRLPDQPEQSLPPHTSIVQAYELAQQELLILGEPGAGKSTLLLELAHHLVEQAAQDTTQPLPVLLPLSSWATKRRPLQEWLAEQFARLYNVPRSLSQQWLEAEQLLPLLDGLDEMEALAHAACVAAINTYHREHLQPLVVCSRTNEYEAAATRERLALHTAIVLQPLSEEQVDTHLVKMGKPLAALRAALRKNTGLGELATTPLMLQVLILTYNGTSVRELSHKEAQLREQIWNDYVQRMVSRKGDAKRYPLQTTITWLSFLAREMRKHDQTILSLEQLQPDWLPKGRRTFYQWSVRLVIGLLGGLSVGLSIGLLFGLLFGHIIGLFFGLLSGLSFGLSFALVFEPGMTTRLAETLTWSWKDLRARFVGWLLGGLIFGLSFGLLSGWLFEQGLGLSSPLGSTLGVGLSSALSIGLSVGLSFGLGIGLFFGFSRKQLTTSEMLSPNEGIRRSIKNGLLIWLSVGVFSGGPVVLIGDLLGRMPLGLSLGLSAGLFVGPGLGLIFGLGAVVQHYIMRFWLAQSGVFPWRAVPFLEDVTARILLRRVGGGYSFAHRLLLDYFADLDAQTPLAQGAAQTKATSCRLYVSFALSVHEFCATSTISGGNVWSRVGGCVTFQENALVRASRHLW